jgi:4-oxalomesaconate tautomerase
VRDTIEGMDVTCIDNGMPVVVMRAADLGVTGYETPEALEENKVLRERVERIRLATGPLMNLGDVTKKNVPKMCLAAPPAQGGHISTRNFIPHRVHKAVGVLGAVSIATACALPGSVAADVARLNSRAGAQTIDVEHPTGFFSVTAEIEMQDGMPVVRKAALLRTARKLMTGEVYVPDQL